jgi:hypothetical protein
VKVEIRHLRSVPGFGPKPGFCVDGARAWCARHGIDWRAFKRDGIAIERIEGIDDAFAQAIVKHVRSEHGR